MPVPQEFVFPTHNTYGISTASLLDTTTLFPTIIWSVEDHIHLAHESGYDGIEIWPQRFRILHQIKSGMFDQALKSSILSAHQSVGSAFPDVRTIEEAQLLVFLPERVASLKDLQNIRKYVDDIAVVLTHETPTSFLRKHIFSKQGIQTYPEVCDFWKVNSAEEFVNKIYENEYDHIVVDTHHIRRKYSASKRRSPLLDWEKTLPKILPYTRELHIGVGRVDETVMSADQLYKETFDILHGGKKKTELVRMLELIRDVGWRGLIITEMRPSVVRSVMNVKSLQLKKNNLVEINKRVRETLTLIFDD